MPENEELVVLATEESGGKRLRILCDKQKLNGYLEITPLAPFIEVRYEEFERLIESKGVIIPDDKRVELQELVAEITDPKFQIEQLEDYPPFPISRGIPPKDGQDGYIEWNIDVPEPGEVRVQIDDRGQADFRQLGRVVNVREQDLLCQLHEPTKGEPGTDIFGKPIPAKSGEKKRFQKGKGVRFAEKSNEFFAELDGCVKWNGTILTVEPVYMVNGDVDFNEGNIKFTGTVIVTGDVKEGFEVEAVGEHGDIEVRGMVEDARLNASGNITVLGGITLSKFGHLKAKGNVVAKYLNNARIDAENDVMVASEVIACEINTQGKVICQKRILGGKIVALGGIDTMEAGAEIGTSTALIINLEHFQTDEIRGIDEAIARNQKQLDQVMNRIGPVLEDPNKLKTMEPKMKEVIKQLIERSEAMEREIDDLNGRRNEVVRKFTDKIGNEIVVRRQLYPGVDVRIDTCRQIFLNAISGPIKLKPNYAKGTIQVSSF